MNRTPLLFLNVLVIAACGLVYELLAGTVASYVLGDSVTQFSLIIGIYMSAPYLEHIRRNCGASLRSASSVTHSRRVQRGIRQR